MSDFQLKKDNRKASDLQALLKRRGFFFPSFEIYGGVAGFFDLGPMGSLLRENIEKAWKDQFVINEGFLLVDCPSITPEIVFKHSGHLDKFSDILTRCTQCSDPFRADHLLEGTIENADALSMEDLEKALLDNSIKCPTCGGKLGPLEEFNLMFKTNIGPGTDRPAFLRPETAQSIFLDFSLLYRSNREKIPFGVAQLGKGFRNEISPRQGLLRQREFHMAEGEFFFDPEIETFEDFERFRDLDVALVANTAPDSTISKKLGDAVKEGMICSEYLGHYMGVTYEFALGIGIPKEHMRFREHLQTEMAHYARDCWDLEVYTSYGWVEMVGIADRSAYDLMQHKKGSGQDLTAMRRYDEPVLKKLTSVDVDMKKLGPVFRGAAREVNDALQDMDPDKVRGLVEGDFELKVEISSGEVVVPKDAVSISSVEKRVSGERFVPHVVEPSFGIDRLMVGVIEHSYFEAEKSPLKEEASDSDGPYRVMRLLPSISPVKCGVLPLMNKDGLPEIALSIEKDLRKRGMITYYDHSGSIGRRYARMDEIGTPFNITIDYETKDDNSVTIRERDTGVQRRVPIKEVVSIIEDLVAIRTSFDEL